MSVGSTTYSYNEMGLLSSVQSPSAKTDFAYSPEGDVVGITTNAGTIHFLGKSVRCFQSSCQLVLKEGPLIINRNAEVSSASIADGLGAPRLTVSQGADTAIWYETYSAFGRPLSNSSVTTSARTGIGGQNFSPEAALYLLGARAFDPKNEVFLGPDPKQSFDNRMALTGKYVYGGGDPFSFEDPQGQLLWFVPIIIGAILGATIAAVSGGNLQAVLKGALIGAIGGAFYWVGNRFWWWRHWICGGQCRGWGHKCCIVRRERGTGNPRWRIHWRSFRGHIFQFDIDIW